MSTDVVGPTPPPELLEAELSDAEAMARIEATRRWEQELIDGFIGTGGRTA